MSTTTNEKPISHRRPGSETRKRQQRIAPRVTDEEFAEIDAKAEAAGLSVSSYAREVLLENARTRSRRRPRADVAILSRACGELNRIGSNLNQIARAVNASEPWSHDELNRTLAQLRDALQDVRAAMGFAHKWVES